MKYFWKNFERNIRKIWNNFGKKNTKEPEGNVGKILK